MLIIIAPPQTYASHQKYLKLVWKRILSIQESSKVDISGIQRQGFEHEKSTTSARLLIQSTISHPLNSDNYALMASINLITAFDLVNTKLLII
jgi:hypothetical protein